MTPRLGLLAGLLALLPSCASDGPLVVREAAPPAEDGRGVVSVRLLVEGGTTERVLELGGLTLVGEDREVALELASGRAELAGRDLLLARSGAPSGHYHGMRVVIDRAFSAAPEQGGAEMILTGGNAVVDLPFDLRDGGAVDLVLRLDLRRSLNDVEFRPAWSVGLAGALLPAEMLLALDPAGGGLVVVDRKQRRVHRSLLPQQALGGMALGRSTDELLLVDTTRDEALLIDLATGEERDRRSLQSAGGVSWATGLPRGDGLAVAQPGRRAIEFLDHPGFLSRGAYSTDRAPGRMAAASNQNRLFVLVPEADELVVVGTDSMETVARLSVDDQPVDLDLDHRGNRLAVACAGSGHVLVYDASSLELLDRIPVGQRPRAVAFDERSARLFVATEGPASVVAVELETGQATSFGRLPSAAADLELDPDGRLLWAACPRAGLLVGFDLFTLRTQVSVEVPGAPDRLLAPGRIRR
jgi:hypothetical protein